MVAHTVQVAACNPVVAAHILQAALRLQRAADDSQRPEAGSRPVGVYSHCAAARNRVGARGNPAGQNQQVADKAARMRVWVSHMRAVVEQACNPSHHHHPCMNRRHQCRYMDIHVGRSAPHCADPGKGYRPCPTHRMRRR